MDQTTLLLPVISVCLLKVVPSHVSPDPAGLHSTTFINPVVSSAGTLQGSKSQQLYFKFLFCFLKHFLDPPPPNPPPNLSLSSLKPPLFPSCWLCPTLPPLAPCGFKKPWCWHAWLWRDLLLHTSRPWLYTCPCSRHNWVPGFNFPAPGRPSPQPLPQILWRSNLPAQAAPLHIPSSSTDFSRKKALFH